MARPTAAKFGAVYQISRRSIKSLSRYGDFWTVKTAVTQYGELQPTKGWDRLASLRHPSKFQPVWHLGFVTARTLFNGGQSNFGRCLAVSWAGTLYTHFWGSCSHGGDTLHTNIIQPGEDYSRSDIFWRRRPALASPRRRRRRATYDTIAERLYLGAQPMSTTVPPAAVHCTAGYLFSDRRNRHT